MTEQTEHDSHAPHAIEDCVNPLLLQLTITRKPEQPEPGAVEISIEMRAHVHTPGELYAVFAGLDDVQQTIGDKLAGHVAVEDLLGVIIRAAGA